MLLCNSETIVIGSVDIPILVMVISVVVTNMRVCERTITNVFLLKNHNTIVCACIDNINLCISIIVMQPHYQIYIYIYILFESNNSMYVSHFIFRK